MKKETIDKIKALNNDRNLNRIHTPGNLAKSISIEANELLKCFLWNEDNYDLEVTKDKLAEIIIDCYKMMEKLGLDEDELIEAKIGGNKNLEPDESNIESTDSLSIEEIQEIEEHKVGKSRINSTYYCILCEMSDYYYDANEEVRKLTKEIKQYLLDVLNSSVKAGRGKMYDPIFACSQVSFYGHFLSWNRNTWRNSAEIVYNYFKAKTLLDCINGYEKIFNRTMIHDYQGFLQYLYEAISKNEEIDYWHAPGIDSAFEYVPEETLNRKLQEFKELYE